MNSLSKIARPHLLAIGTAFLVIFAYFPGVFLESKELDMSDINRSSATSKEARDFRNNTGEEALWTNSQFGGMPTYQMNIEYPGNLMSWVEKYSKYFLSYGLDLLFIMFLGFYLISAFLGVTTWISITGAFAFAFSTYFIVSLEAGHTGKLRAIGYMAPVLMAVLLTFRGKYLLGGALTCLFVSLAINANHFQITYYLGMMIMVFLLVELYYHLKEKELKGFFLKSTVIAFAALLAVGPNISRLWTTYGYSKETMRGGSSELKSYKDAEGGGLEKDYAMSWSYGVAETMTLLIPDFYGGSSTASLPLNSATGEDIRKRGVLRNQLDQIMQSLPVYWGDQPFTTGPVFAGSAIIYLFILSLFVLKGRLKVWLLSCTILSIVLSWGKNFDVVTDLFFYYFPLYNKFRTPSMLLSICCLTIPLLSMLGLTKILEAKNGMQTYLPEIRKAFYITGGLCLTFALIGPALFSFTGESDSQLPQGWPIEALIEDRIDLLQSSALMSFIFVLATFLLLWAYSKNKLSLRYFIAGIIAVIAVDLWIADKKYLNDNHLVKRKSRDAFYVDSEADKLIMQDKDPNYRVLNLSVNPFTDALTSFHHKSVGGYHGAKLIRYQDMIEQHLSKNNTRVIDMLNTRYYIVRNNETGALEVRGNPGALGNAWFVNTIMWVENADEEIALLNQFNPSEEVVIDVRYKSSLSGDLTLDKANSKIKLVHYQPNKLIYETEVNSSGQFAVFSEIYYEGTNTDWKVFIDDQPSKHIRVNYVLRGMEIPAGNHKIEFRFEPESYFKGEEISLSFSIGVALLVLGAFGVEYFRMRRKDNEG